MTSQLDFESYYNKLFEKWSWNVSAYGAYKKIQIELHEGRLKQNDLSQFMEAFEIVFGRKGADDVRSMLKNRNSRPTLSLVGKVRGGSPVLMYTDTDNTSIGLKKLVRLSLNSKALISLERSPTLYG